MLIVMTGHSSLRAPSRRRFRTFKWLAEACSGHQIPVFMMTPNGVSPNPKLCRGWMYHIHETPLWQPATTSLQSATVYDAMYLRDVTTYWRQYNVARRILRSAGVTVFNPQMSGKDVIYKYLQRHASDVIPLPQTAYITSSVDVLNILEHTPQIWFKPIHGSGGRNMLWIQRMSRDRYLVKAHGFYRHRFNHMMTRSELLHWIRAGRKHHNYIVQEHIPLVQTPSGRKVDFRVTIQRGLTGEWEVIAITARFGVKGAMVTNYHAGGEVLSCTTLTPSVKAALTRIGLRHKDVKLASTIALEAGRALQRNYPNLGILGVDVGLTDSGKMFLYDFNSRPGRDILLDREIRRSMYTIADYTEFLSRGV